MGQLRQQAPVSRQSLAEDLARLGIIEGDLLLVHASIRSLGFVIGGAASVVAALRDVIGENGTLVVPTTTAGNTDPSRWARTRRQEVPECWWPAIRQHLPAFDSRITPSEGVGAFAEAVRVWPSAVRSTHPQTSFAALGPQAVELMAIHDLDCHYGPQSPLGTLFGTAAKVLLLGVPFTVCTAFHLAEYSREASMRDYECVIADGGVRRWHRYRDVVLDDGDFGQVGAALEVRSGVPVRRGCVGGAADSRLLPLREAVMFAGDWFRENRVPRARLDHGDASGPDSAS